MCRGKAVWVSVRPVNGESLHPLYPLLNELSGRELTGSRETMLACRAVKPPSGTFDVPVAKLSTLARSSRLNDFNARHHQTMTGSADE